MAGNPKIARDKILAGLHDKPGITHGQIVKETGLAKNTVTRHLNAIRAEWAKPKVQD